MMGVDNPQEDEPLKPVGASILAAQDEEEKKLVLTMSQKLPEVCNRYMCLSLVMIQLFFLGRVSSMVSYYPKNLMQMIIMYGSRKKQRALELQAVKDQEKKKVKVAAKLQ